MTYRRGIRGRPVDAILDLDLHADPGEVIGVLGPNGSGKTTLLEVLCGALAPSAGSAAILGQPAGCRSLAQRVGYQPEGPLPFPLLSAGEFLEYLGILLELPRARAKARATTLLDRLALAHAGKRPLGTFSAGMARRLAIAGALLSQPRVVLLDEPTAGIDPEGSLTILELIAEAVGDGGTVIMASHRLDEVEQACDRVYLLDRGRCQSEGKLDELLETEDRELIVRGLDADAVEHLEAQVRAAGGEVVRAGHARRNLFALFRSFSRK